LPLKDLLSVSGSASPARRLLLEVLGNSGKNSNHNLAFYSNTTKITYLREREINIQFMNVFLFFITSTPPAVTAKTTMNRLKKLKEEQAAAIALEKKN